MGWRFDLMFLISTIETALEIPSIPARPAVTLVTPGVLLNWHSNLRVILAMSYVIAEPYIGGHGRRVCRSSSAKIADTGQTGTQAPQSMHSTGSMKSCCASPNSDSFLRGVNAIDGQASAR
jgi:hypothetical protein